MSSSAPRTKWRRESSDFALSSDNYDQAYAAYHVLGGAEFTTRRLVGFAVEAQFTTVPGALGNSGASAAFNEHNLDGFQVRVKVLICKTLTTSPFGVEREHIRRMVFNWSLVPGSLC